MGTAGAHGRRAPASAPRGASHGQGRRAARAEAEAAERAARQAEAQAEQARLDRERASRASAEHAKRHEQAQHRTERVAARRLAALRSNGRPGRGRAHSTAASAGRLRPRHRAVERAPHQAGQSGLEHPLRSGCDRRASPATTESSGPAADGAPRSRRRRSGTSASEPDLTDPSLYFNRELSWLDFNDRVLQLAEDPRVPLLERVNFSRDLRGQPRRVLHGPRRRPPRSGRCEDRRPRRRCDGARRRDRG